MRDALARGLASLPGIDVREAAEPKIAFEVIGREPDLDLVLLDLALPGMHGLTALKSLRAKHPAIAVVIASGNARTRWESNKPAQFARLEALERPR